MTENPPLRILLCSPRGFCAGVVRAIEVVEKALDRFGAPVYVRHEIVHNRYVVDSLKAKGAIFVEELSEVPDTTSPVIFSAHGVAKSVPAEAKERNLLAIDATCPLVTKVHREAEIHRNPAATSFSSAMPAIPKSSARSDNCHRARSFSSSRSRTSSGCRSVTLPISPS